MIQPLTFESEWARCSAWIEAALESLPVKTHTLDDVKAMVERGEARFWAGRGAAAVTQIDTYPLLKAASVWLAGGDLNELRDEMGPQFERWATANGCRFVSVTGRQGFGRALGYTPIHWTCAKELI